MGSASVQNETAGRPTRNWWTEEDSTRLRDLIASGLDIARAAAELGRPVGSVQTQLSRLGISPLNLERRTRDRIIELAKEGWTLSRLSKQVGVDEAIAARALRQAGLEPKAISSYAAGRYGRDIPLPQPGQVVALPIAAPKIPPRTAFDDLTQTRKRPWTPEQIVEFEQRVRAGETPIQIGAAMGRSAAALQAKFRAVQKLIATEAAPAPDAVVEASAVEPSADAGGKRPWTPAEDEVLRGMVENGRSVRDAAAELGRTTAAVTTRRSILALGAARRARSADAPETPVAIVEAPSVETPAVPAEAEAIAPDPTPEMVTHVLLPATAPTGLSASLVAEIERFERRIREDLETVAMMRTLAGRLEARPG